MSRGVSSVVGASSAAGQCKQSRTSLTPPLQTAVSHTGAHLIEAARVPPGSVEAAIGEARQLPQNVEPDVKHLLGLWVCGFGVWGWGCGVEDLHQYVRDTAHVKRL